MTKIYETKVRQSYEYKKEVARKCDLCSKQSYTGDWGDGCYKIDEVEIKTKVFCTKGTSHPYNGSTTDYDIDLCPKCFEEKLIPWLKSQGAEIKPVKVDL